MSYIYTIPFPLGRTIGIIYAVTKKQTNKKGAKPEIENTHSILCEAPSRKIVR
jgi:hypothetical protein